MKKIALILAVLAIAGVAQAETKQHTFSASCATTNQGTSAQIVKGTIKSIYFDVPATKTGDVTVVSSEGFTVFAVDDVTTDTLYVPQTPLYTTEGAALTATYSTWNNITNSTGTYALYGDITCVGTLTATFEPNADTTGTNTWKALINYEE